MLHPVIKVRHKLKVSRSTEELYILQYAFESLSIACDILLFLSFLIKVESQDREGDEDTWNDRFIADFGWPHSRYVKANHNLELIEQYKIF